VVDRLLKSLKSKMSNRKHTLSGHGACEKRISPQKSYRPSMRRLLSSSSREKMGCRWELLAVGFCGDPKI
jgi:hypothetical protein